VQQRWDAALYDGRHAFVYEYGRELAALLDPGPGERILDLGCGTGHLTQAIADAGAEVVGLDASADMVECARREHPGLTFVEADARAFALEPAFDAIFSNAALHWIGEPGTVAARVAAHLRPGGRFVAEFGGKGNVATMLAALEGAARDVARQAFANPWYFPALGEYAAVLEGAGLEVRFATLFDRPTRLDDGERGLAAWVAMFLPPAALGDLDEAQRGAVVARAAQMLRPALFRDGAWYADYRRLRVVAVRPA
jgi:trans-aconitate methyltransferase